MLAQNRIIKVPLIFSNFSFWGESVKRNGIIMISKGYHYVNLGTASIFHISIDPAYPGSCARGSISVGELRRIWVPLLHGPSNSLSTMSFDRA